MLEAGSSDSVARHSPAPQPWWWWHFEERDVREGKNDENVRSEDKSVRNSPVSTEVGEEEGSTPGARAMLRQGKGMVRKEQKRETD